MTLLENTISSYKFAYVWVTRKGDNGVVIDREIFLPFAPEVQFKGSVPAKKIQK